MTPQECYALLRLRVQVFVVEQACAYPELDGRDLEPGVEHVWIQQGVDLSEPTALHGYLRVLPEPDVAGAGEGLRIGRVVTEASRRGTGVAARLMDDVIARQPEVAMVLDAQTYAVDFYARFGFTPVGRKFLEDGIEHLSMVRLPR